MRKILLDWRFHLISVILTCWLLVVTFFLQKEFKLTPITALLNVIALFICIGVWYFTIGIKLDSNQKQNQKNKL